MELCALPSVPPNTKHVALSQCDSYQDSPYPLQRERDIGRYGEEGKVKIGVRAD